VSDTLKLQVTMANDEEGFFGRECPNDDCLGYFKIELGTGLKGESLPCHCPYCGHTGPHNTFWTQDQLKYLRSASIREVQKYVGNMLKRTFPPSRPRHGDFISISFKYKAGRPLPLYRYQEKQLETVVVCSMCSLRYAVYGVFGYCPDCGSHNSLQILNANLDLALRELDLSSSVDGQLADQLVTDALENVVSTFDAFGRELFRLNKDLSVIPEDAQRLSCQNLVNLDSRVSKIFGFSLSPTFLDDEWRVLIVSFQKRHLIAHRMGVIDQTYITATGDSEAIVGRRISLNRKEVESVLPLIRKLGEFIYDSLRSKRDKLGDCGC
jgi:hypothetical protein